MLGNTSGSPFVVVMNRGMLLQAPPLSHRKSLSLHSLLAYVIEQSTLAVTDESRCLHIQLGHRAKQNHALGDVLRVLHVGRATNHRPEWLSHTTRMSYQPR